MLEPQLYSKPSTHASEPAQDPSKATSSRPEPDASFSSLGWGMLLSKRVCVCGDCPLQACSSSDVHIFFFPKGAREESQLDQSLSFQHGLQAWFKASNPKLLEVDLLVVMIAAAIHDIAHPATNNALRHNLKHLWALRTPGPSAVSSDLEGLSFLHSDVVSALPCESL